jgi:tetratricopeptide (TPR) repeat protein
MSDALSDDLREQLARRQVVVVVGAGVAVAATGGASSASWLGLLQDGVARCEAVIGHGLPAGWGDRVRAQIDSGDVEELLSAAENITRRLGGPGGGEYGRWLRDSVGSLEVTDPEVIQALAGLRAPIATTNYDSLIEQVTDLPTVTWRQGALIERVIRRDDLGVVHLHGHWQDPASVVLGIRSYEAVLGDEHAQAVQRALAMLQSLLFVGFGAGLTDPNFGALRAWLGRVLPGSQYRHFRLGRNGELPALQAEHGVAERIMVMGYGPNHADLAPTLRTLAPAESVPSAKDADAAGLSVLAAVALPPPPRCFGRDPIIDDLVQTVCAKRSSPTPVLGPPGIGKSTVCLAALHHRWVAARFGQRRWFVRCNAAITGAGLLAEIATALHVMPGPDQVAKTVAALGAEPGLLVLDNVETPWEADIEGTEAVLAQLAGIAELRLLITVRGAQRPFGVPWRESVLVPPLGVADGRRVFLAVAGQRFAADPHLDELVVAQDGVPLAIELLAYVAEAEPDLAGLWRRWQAKRVALLRRGSANSPQLSAEVSFDLSISGPRMTELAQRLLGLLSLLPDGVAYQDLEVLLPGEGEEAASTLRRVGLAFDENQRLRMLQPLREYAREHHRPEPDDLTRAAEHYRQLAIVNSPKLGGPDGAAAAVRLIPEAANIEEMLLQQLEGDDPIPAALAADALSHFQQLSGFGSTRALEAALIVAQENRDAVLQARLLQSLGDRAYTGYDFSSAGGYYERAQSLYEQAENLEGQANCIKGLGDIAFWRSDDVRASSHYERAQSLYEQAENLQGQANCIKGLGDIAYRRIDYTSASGYYQRAQSLYERTESLQGKANCLSRLGDIASVHDDYESAIGYFKQAQSLYIQVGDILGQANTLGRLGHNALRQYNDATAIAYFQRARALFEELGNLQGQANCIRGLAQIALKQTNYAAAIAHFERALGLYNQIPQPHSVGIMHAELARLANTPDERGHHIERARDIWISIGRADLIDALDAEFGDG